MIIQNTLGFLLYDKFTFIYRGYIASGWLSRAKNKISCKTSNYCFEDSLDIFPNFSAVSFIEDLDFTYISPSEEDPVYIFGCITGTNKFIFIKTITNRDQL